MCLCFLWRATKVVVGRNFQAAGTQHCQAHDQVVQANHDPPEAELADEAHDQEDEDVAGNDIPPIIAGESVWITLGTALQMAEWRICGTPFL